MPSSRFVHWRAAGACVVPVAVVAASLLISGVANSAPPGSIPQVTEDAAATTTQTMLTASPVSPVGQGSPVMLTATVSPATAVGTVQFKDGDRPIGDPVMVSNGTASRSTSTLPIGQRSLTAVFTPSSPAAFAPSTSQAVTVVVAGAADTTTTLTTSPASQVVEGTPVTLTTTVTPATTLGTVQFKDGNNDIGGPVSVSNGTASRSTSTLPIGQRSLTAVFIPSNATAFNPSTSSAVPLTVTDSGVASLQTLTSQQSGLSLDIRVAVLDNRVNSLDGEPSVLGVSMPFLDGRGLILDARLSLLDGHGLLSDQGLLSDIGQPGSDMTSTGR